MKAHVIENAKVINTIEVESLDVLPNLIDAEVGAIGWGYVDGLLTPPVIELKFEDIKLLKCQEIALKTKKSIIALAGSLEQQSNKQAKASQLILKKVIGTITQEETALLEYLNGLFVQIETLINDGNAKEAEIMACTTAEEFEAVVAG